MDGRARRDFWVQAAGLAAFIGGVAWIALTVWTRLIDQGIATGFDILGAQTGWQLSNAPFGQVPSDPYWWTFVNSFANTLILGLLGIMISTVVGVVLGFGRVSENPALRLLFAVYVEIFRNVPLVVQIVFWYGLFLRLPPVQGAVSLGNVVILSNRGLALPTLQTTAGGSVLSAVLVAGIVMLPVAWLIWRLSAATMLKAFAGVVSAVAVFLSVVAAMPEISLELPRAGRFAYAQGFVLNIELAALTLGIVMFSAAYIGEIVRGGLEAVDRGQVEAARAVGLTEAQVLWDIRLPLALRLIVPPIGNQYIFTMKATALGSAVGYSEIFSASVVSINQTGRTIEFLFLMMATYILINFVMSRLVNLVNGAIALKGHK